MINILTYDETTTITPDEHAMTLEDGTELFYRTWIPREPVRKALVIFHRGHEHSGRLKDVVRDLHLRDVAVFAWDARGHGYSEGPRGYAPSFSCTARDADEFIRHISDIYAIQIEDMVVLGHSVGAVTVALWIHDYAPRVRAMVLVHTCAARETLRAIREDSVASNAIHSREAANVCIELRQGPLADAQSGAGATI